MMIAAIIILIILAALGVFQVALIAGAPLGRFAWGGQHDILPRRLRIGSVISICIYVLLAVLVASKVGLLNVVAAGAFLDVCMWITMFYFAAGILLNGISRSKPERYVMTPVTIVLTVCFMVLVQS